MTPHASVGNPYCPPSETPQKAESSPLQLPIQGVVWVDETLLRKAIRYRIRRKGYVWQLLTILTLSGGVVGAAAFNRWRAADPLFVWLAWLYVVLVGLVAVVVFATRYWAHRVFHNLNPYETPGTFGEHRIEITDHTFRRANDHSELTWRLESMSGVSRHPDLLLVEIAPNSFMAIPPTADFGVNSFEAVAKYLESRVGRRSS